MAETTSNWSKLGDFFFRRFELYSMNWRDHMVISEYNIAAASYGGPIATVKKPMYESRSDSKSIIRTYNAAGNKLCDVKWQEGGKIIKIGWSASENLVCVQDDGVVVIFDIFGQMEGRFDMGQEALDRKIADCRIFNSYHDSGVIIMTTTYKFWIKSDITSKSSARRLADIPGLNAPPSSWIPIARDGNMCALVAKDSALCVTNPLGLCQLQDINISNPDVIAYTDMATSFNNKYIALFTQTGMLWIGTTDLQFESGRQNRPTQMAWCGSSAVLIYWENLDFLVVGPNEDSVSFDLDLPVLIVPEMDGARLVADDIHEFIERVPDVTTKIFDIVSVEPGAYLFEAERKFRQQSKEANDYLSLIQDQMPFAVEQCIEAAGHEYEPPQQKELLKAASFGKSFANTSNPDQFYHMCQTIRVLNAVREYTIGIPLTLKQLNLLKVETLIDRLVYRQHYLLARKICQYLRLRDVEMKILARWACYMVEKSREPDHVIAASIQEKLGDSSGVSYSEIATQAIDSGKKQLAVMLLEHEPRVFAQIPLLMKIDSYDTALRKAIESGDSNLVYQVIFDRKDRLRNMASFLLEIGKHPEVLSLAMKYYQSENPELLMSLFKQEDHHMDMATYNVLESLDRQGFDGKRDSLLSAQHNYRDAHDDWAVKMVEDEMKLMDKQRQFESMDIPCLNKSLHETLHTLIVSGRIKEADALRKEFNVPERRFWWLKVKALAESFKWTELESFSRQKKVSPIGYRPFVEACYNKREKLEGSKYLVKVAPDEKVKCLINIGEKEQAAELAFERRNEDELNMVLQQCTVSDRVVFDRVQRLKAQLRQS